MEHSLLSSCRDRRQLCNVRCETHTLGSLQTVICLFLLQSMVERGLEGLEIDVAPNGSPALRLPSAPLSLIREAGAHSA